MKIVKTRPFAGHFYADHVTVKYYESKMESESEDVQSDSETETDEETPKRKVLSCCNA